MKFFRASQRSVVHIEAVLTSNQSPVRPAEIFQRLIDTVVCKRCLSQSFRHQSTSCAKHHMKSAPLGLAGGREWILAAEPLPVAGDRMTALIHYERQRWKKVNFFAKKPLPRSLFQHVQTLCIPSFIDLHQAHQEYMYSCLHAHATPGHVTSFTCSRNTSDRSLVWWHHRRRSTRVVIDRGRGETWNTSGKPHVVACCTSSYRQ